MKLKNNTLILFVLSLILLTFIMQSFAIYASNYDNLNLVSVAKWQFNEDNPYEKITINLDNSADLTNLSGGKIAPGSKGNFTIKVSNKTSDVAINYKIDILESNVPMNFHITNYEELKEGLLNYHEEKDLTFYWEWDYSSSLEMDEDDSLYMGKDLILNLAITGSQKIN